MQEQINAINEDQKKRDATVGQKAKETLLDNDTFAQAETAEDSDDDDLIAPHLHGGHTPLLSKFENAKSKFAKKLKTERFQEPRMFTMEQIRNIAYACLN